MAERGLRGSRLSAPAADTSKAVFIDIARGLAALLVVYLHVYVLWLGQNQGRSTLMTDAISAAASDPLQLGIQDVGAIAVPLFFLVSGFVVTPIAMRRGGGRFCLNRFFRLVPLLVVAVLLAAGALAAGLHPLSGDRVGPITPEAVLVNISLLNYVLDPRSAILGVTWSLLVEVFFYLLLILVLPLLRRAPWLAVAVELTLIEVVITLRGVFEPVSTYFAIYAALVALPVIGQVIWAGYTRRIPMWLAWLYGGAAWSLFVWSTVPEVDGVTLEGFPIAVALAILLFLAGLFAEPHLMRRRVWTYLSERLYSIYLMHGIVAFLVLEALYGALPLWLVLLAALGATLAGVEVAYRLVERPSHLVGRRLGRPRGPSEPTEVHEAPGPALAVAAPAPSWAGIAADGGRWRQDGAAP